MGSTIDVYVSTDSGATFVSAGLTNTTFAANDTASFFVAMSSDASKMFAASSTGLVLGSSDQGSTWSLVNDLNTTTSWTSLAATSDASTLLASTTYRALYTSDDYGVTWTSIYMTGFNPDVWDYVDISSDGAVLVASSKLNPIWVSTDAGETWGKTGDSDAWTSVSLTGDGQTIITSSQGIDKISKATYSPADA